MATFAVAALAAMVTGAAAALGFRIVIHPVAFPAAVLGAHVFVLHKLEDADWSVVWLHRAAARAKRWAPATLLAAGAITVPAVVLVAGGWFGFGPGTDGDPITATLWIAALVIPFALAEELLVRGYVFTILRRLWGWQWALAITSVGFGLLHLPNPGANALAIINVTLAGVFLGFILVRTDSLYAAWGAHAAWNFALAAILHADVSGIGMGEPVGYRLVDRGPWWLTGGAWGPEGGIAATIGMLAAIAIVARFILQPVAVAHVREGSGWQRADARAMEPDLGEQRTDD